MKTRFALFIMLCAVPVHLLIAQDTAAARDLPEQLNRQLGQGRFEEAINQLEGMVESASDRDQVLFALGTVRVLSAVESLAQTINRFGPVDNTFLFMMSGMSIGAPQGLNAKDTTKVRYDDVRAAVQTFITDLDKARKALSAMSPQPVKLPIHFGLIRMDLNADGRSTPEEAFWRLFNQINRTQVTTEEQAAAFIIAFDRGDAYWLEGYCHLLMGLGEAFLAYDHRDLFEHTGHLFFEQVDTPYGFLRDAQRPRDWSTRQISDIIAFIHLLRFEVKEPERMKRSLEHFRQVLASSRQMWAAVLSESDDDREWIPHPGQTGVLDIGISQERVDAWLAFVEEAEALLEGRKLAPFWRGEKPGAGINIHRIFTEPTRFDLVLWFQGPGLAKYVEKGELTHPEIWQQLQRVFRGSFVNFALWWN